MGRIWAIFMCLLLALPTQAQQSPASVLVIDGDQIYFESQYGKRLEAALANDVAEVRAENDQIVATLREEELSLAERRPDMDPEQFREEAEAFDAKVTDVRSAREAKAADLQDRQSSARVEFESRVEGIIANIMLERRASVVLDKRRVVVWVTAADITNDVITRLDAQLGDGTR